MREDIRTAKQILKHLKAAQELGKDLKAFGWWKDPVATAIREIEQALKHKEILDAEDRAMNRTRK